MARLTCPHHCSWPILGGLASLAVVASACAGHPPDGMLVPLPVAPASAHVAGGRYVNSIELDDSGLVVTPAPSSRRPSIGERAADLLFRSDEAVTGIHRGALLGFGLVSIRASLTDDHFPRLHATPAWVGLAWGGVTSCPARPATTTPSSPPPTPGYTAVVVLGSGRTVLAYASRTSSCGEPPAGPGVSQAPEVVSVPWRQIALSGHTVTFRYQGSSCDPAAPPMPQLLGNAYTGEATLSVLLDVPYPDAACPATWSTDSASSQPSLPPGAPVPPGRPAVAPLRGVAHGPMGPVPVLQVEPGGSARPVPETASVPTIG